MNEITRISDTLSLRKDNVRNVLKLLEDGATIPFIARYRKEATGSLDEMQIADIEQEKKRLDELESRKQTILKAIEEQDKLTPELRDRIQSTYDATVLEDLYLPYKRKRKTRAGVARARGLEPLANSILLQQDNSRLEELARNFLSEEVADVSAALEGARDIIAERVNEDEATRNLVRRQFKREATIRAKVARGKEEAGEKYQDYFDFEEPLRKCPSHRLLAIRRGEEEGILRVLISPDDEDTTFRVQREWVRGSGAAAEQVKEAVADSYKRLLAPSIETEFRNLAKELADAEAIEVFTENLRQLLLSPPLGQQRVLGIDPGFRTGCKVVVINANGDLLDNTTIYPHPPQRETEKSAHTITTLVQHFDIDAIAVGNGTAGRETVAFCRSLPLNKEVQVFSVNESGASIYSASAIAREEFPEYDVTVRGAVSIGRRLMDPLAELVKIDPKSIGVGQYQHDVNQSRLKESLDRVVESCVNRVGINLNTASKHLLTYVSGLGPTLAQNIVDYRSAQGRIQSRDELMKVKRMGDKAYEQAAGFLRVRESSNPLDNTAVHPESYHVVERMASDLGCSVADLIQSAGLRQQVDLPRYVDDKIGLPTLKDIMKELAKPGLDPRGEAKAFEFANIQRIEDLEPGMTVPGIVNNITNFGAFVDIGIKESGLVHISQLADRFVKSPADVVSLQQQVTVKVLEVDVKRKRIQLSMKNL